MADKITWADKTTGTSGHNGKVTSGDMNEIKSVVNSLSDLLDARVIDGGFTGSIDGLNTLFTLSANPTSPETVEAFVNGLRQKYNLHFSVSGAIVTIFAAPLTDDNVSFNWA